MKILIELPTWMGDTVMTLPTIHSLIKFYKVSEISFIGSEVSLNLIKLTDIKAKLFFHKKSYIQTYLLARKVGKYDLFISFRSSIRSKYLKFFIRSPAKYQYNPNLYKNIHQVEKYFFFVKSSLNIEINLEKIPLFSFYKKNPSKIKKIGINPGATYGDSKRWGSRNFARLINELSANFEIFMFGGPGEIEIGLEIEKLLTKSKCSNLKNLIGKTSIDELYASFQDLDLLITNDSGPMHLAAAMNIPTISIFGPTNFNETSPWNNFNISIRRNLSCQPCMKRVCPLKHNNCMNLINTEDVLKELTNFDLVSK